MFAAFPGIRDRIKGLIDDAVELAVDAVNALAEALKDAVNALLDLLAAALDALLAAYQAVLNAVLAVLKILAAGLLEILKGIANLGKGMWAMLPQFWGKLTEEFLGTDLSEPLPNIERTEAEVAEHEGGGPAGLDGAEMPEGLDAPKLSDGQVGIGGAPLELDSGIVDQLPPMADGDQFEMGGAEVPVTTEELQADAQGAPLTEDAGAAPAVADPGPVPSDDQVAGESEGPDFASMGDQEKLDYHIEQMGQDSAGPTTDDSKDPSVATNDPGVPYEAKTNPLSVSQRFDFAIAQMKKGMEIFWNENKEKIIAGLIGLLIVGGLIAFFTAGTGIVPFLQLVMQALLVYFIADALWRVKGHMADYFTKSWGGQTEEGGGSLATALAIVCAEFVLEYVLKGVGSCLLYTSPSPRDKRQSRMPSSA